MHTDASSSVPHADALGPSSPDLQLPVRTGLNWRHGATLLLLTVTLPVFVAAAAVCLPVLLVGLLVQQGLKVARLIPASPRTPVRMARVRN